MFFFDKISVEKNRLKLLLFAYFTDDTIAFCKFSEDGLPRSRHGRL